MTRLCLTLAEASHSTLSQKIARFTGQVSLIEVRLDFLAESRLPDLPEGSPTEFIATCRPEREGGRFRGPESTRLALLGRAAGQGFDWIDLEHDVDEFEAGSGGVRVIRSLHRFDAFPSDLADDWRRVKRKTADLYKLAVPVFSTRELVHLFDWMQEIRSESSSLIIGMGSMGEATRLLGGMLGNPWSYVVDAPQSRVAPGQCTLAEARDLYRLEHWTDRPDLYGVIGNPVAHSRSPWIHNHLFQHYGLDSLYIPLHLDSLEPWFDFLKRSALNFRGFSVTLPFKSDVVPFTSNPSAPAVNTLVRQNGGWQGLNTDRSAFLLPLKARVPIQGQSALVLGNGGVAHTVVEALQEEGASVLVAGRNAEKLDRFCRAHRCRAVGWQTLSLPADICVNTTPVGQFPDTGDSPLEDHQLQFGLVYDLIYSPERTRLLQLAEARGIPTITGLEMFIEQAALQFRTWTGLDPDRELMRDLMRRVEPL